MKEFFTTKEAAEWTGLTTKRINAILQEFDWRKDCELLGRTLLIPRKYEKFFRNYQVVKYRQEARRGK
jgi:hypothetical protein